MERNKNKDNSGFTLIELLVVIAIIALLASVALIAYQEAREKSRDAKRLGDMTEMSNAFQLFFSSYQGYPASSLGLPQSMSEFLSSLPSAPAPADLACEGLIHSNACIQGDPNCANVPANTYYYIASGTPIVTNGQTAYPDFAYYFCLGNTTGNFSAGERVLTPSGVR